MVSRPPHRTAVISSRRSRSSGRMAVLRCGHVADEECRMASGPVKAGAHLLQDCQVLVDGPLHAKWLDAVVRAVISAALRRARCRGDGPPLAIARARSRPAGVSRTRRSGSRRCRTLASSRRSPAAIRSSSFSRARPGSLTLGTGTPQSRLRRGRLVPPSAATTMPSGRRSSRAGHGPCPSWSGAPEAAVRRGPGRAG